MNSKAMPSVTSSPAGDIFMRVRRNHGLEHATLHVLSNRQPRRPLAGYSDWGGFWIVGDVSLEELQEAVFEALRRLQAGEHALAVHPNCGTNFVLTGILAGGAAALALWGIGRRWRDTFDRLPLVFTLSTLAVIAAQPIGLALQRQVTTCADPGSLHVVEITLRQTSPTNMHRVTTQS